MKKIFKFPQQNQCQEEASHWLVKLDCGALSQSDSDAFRRWLDASPANREAITRLAKTWDDMDLLSELSELFPLSKHSLEQQTSTPAKHRPLIKQAFMVAASLLVVLTLGWSVQNNWMGFTNTTHDSILKTAIGEQSNFVLADGSTATLNTDSLVAVAINDEQRDIRLIKGEAHFDVAHNPDIPFVVHAGTGMIRAVGTAFTVYLKDDHVEVTVTEGKVEIISAPDSSHSVQPDNNTGKMLTTVGAGQLAAYDDGLRSVQTVKPEVIARKLAWRTGMLEFEGETLEHAVKEISRYTRTKLVISDPDIRNTRVAGYFKAGDIPTLLSTLKNNFGIDANHVNDNLVYLSRLDSTEH